MKKWGTFRLTQTFGTGQGIKVIEDQITNLLSVVGDRNPLPSSYWTGTLHYKEYFYYDSLVMKVYIDGILTSLKPFPYPYYHTD